jgi:hypothetical protein
MEKTNETISLLPFLGQKNVAKIIEENYPISFH